MRCALGASPADVIRLVLGAGARLAAIGMILGLGMFLSVERVLGSLVYGVGPNDPLTVLLAVVLLSVVSFVAALQPGLRALRVAPTESLRAE